MKVEKLGHRVTFTVPADVSLTVEMQDTVSVLEKDMCVWFGGVTTYNARGLWCDENDTIVPDDVYVLESYTTRPDAGRIAEDWARVLCRELDQECIAYTFDGAMYLVYD